MKWDSAYKVSGRENVLFNRLLSLRLPAIVFVPLSRCK